MDFGKSDDPRVQTQLDRLSQLSVPQGRLGLETIRALMERLGNPHRILPPVFHVAGTNGKGSVCAFLRAMLEADGKRVHVTTSPHLVRYNERIRVAGELISDEALAALLEEVLDKGEDLAPSFFEVTIAAAFLAFSRTPADACVVEVGLGGRFDATNVLEPEALAACGIAALGIDHERFLLAPEEGVPKEPIARIAFEKAGIAKKGVPLVTMGKSYPDNALEAIKEIAKSKGAVFKELSTTLEEDIAFFDPWENGIAYDNEDEDECEFNLLGNHQVDNASLARDILRSQHKVEVKEASIQLGVTKIKWPARLQELSMGPLTVLAPEASILIDGGHNPNAGKAIASFLWRSEIHVIIGMLEGKDPAAILDALAEKEVRTKSISVVPVPNHESHPVEAFGPNAVARRDLEDALLGIPDAQGTILIAGSLYLAGEALKLNDEVPD